MFRICYVWWIKNMSKKKIIIIVATIIVFAVIITGCDGLLDVSVEEMPEFAFIVSETSDTGVGNVTYICKNGDILKLNDEELDENTFDERIEKHTKGGYKDNIKKTISQDEVVEHYKTFLKLFEEKGNKMLEYPMALPDVVSSRCNWYGVCYSQGKVETVLLHAYDRMTNISSDDEKVNELYKWIEKVR